MSELALFGGSKSKQKSFPLWPQYDENERRALLEVLESRVWWRTPGTKTLEFEKGFAAYHGARHGIAVTNGTAALEVTIVFIAIITYIWRWQYVFPATQRSRDPHSGSVRRHHIDEASIQRAIKHEPKISRWIWPGSRLVSFAHASATRSSWKRAF